MERRSSGRGGSGGSRSSSESPRRSGQSGGDGDGRTGRSVTSTTPRSSSIGTPGKRLTTGVTPNSTPGKSSGIVAKGKVKVVPTTCDLPPPATTAENEELDVSVSTSVEGGSEESHVKLNSRGMPARQIKRNRFYFDGDNITDEASWKQARKGSPSKVKQEPVEVDEEDDDEGADFPHAETEESYAPLKSAFAKGTVSNRPTPVEVAQALTALVKPRGPGRPPKVKQEKVSSASTPRRNEQPTPGSSTPAKKSETTKTPKQTPLKISRPETSKGASSGTPKGHQTPTDRGSKPETSKSTGKSDARSSGRNDTPGKSDRYLHSIPSTSASSEKPREVHKIKKERDTDLMLSISVEGTSREDKIRLKKDKDRQARDKERREYRREKEHQDEDEDFSPTSPGKGRRRVSLGDSFSENVIVVPNDIIADSRPSLDKKSAQEISLRLRNLLKLPKAHKWVCYEWFYSNIDKVLFEGENDFQICFRESFPQLKARKLTRVEWTKIRRLMGKPRRCSQSFFDEEREELCRRRQKIRMIQQRKVTDFNYKELPDEIPLQLVIGTKVTSRLRRPQDGLFTGTIEGVDTSNNTYRITFDRPGLGTHSIPDYEVLSNETPETVSTSSFALKIPRRNYGAFSGGQFKFNSSAGDELTGFPKSPFPVDGMLGGFPIRLLDMIVRLSKLLKAKREKILQLKELNVEAEKMRSYGKTFNSDFRCRYARVVVDLSSMNREMAVYLDGVQQYCLEIAPDHGANQMIVPEHIQEQCDHEAALIISNCNGKPNRVPVQGTKALTLITKLASIMLQVKTLSSGDRNLYELKSIKDSLKDIKASLEGRNVQLFQDRVEIPMNRIQAGLTMSGNH